MAKGESAAGWTAVINEPKTFDLMKIMGIEELLGSSELTAGEYNQVRLDVENVEVTIGGETIVGTVPSGKLRIVGRFDSLVTRPV